MGTKAGSGIHHHHHNPSKADNTVAVTLPVPAQASAAVPGVTDSRRRSSGSNKNVTNADDPISRHDLPLSHTWHGGAPQQEIGGPGNGRRSSRFRAVRNRTSRDLEGGGGGGMGEGGGPTTPTGGGAAANPVAALWPATPSKSVKFMVGRRRSSSSSVTSPRERIGSSDNNKGSAGSSRRSSLTRASSGSEETADPRGSVMNVIVQACVWADYFNNTLRCWEALLDPFRYWTVVVYRMRHWFLLLGLCCVYSR